MVRLLLSAICVALLAGCGGGAPPISSGRVLVEHALLVDVAADESFLAYYSAPLKTFGYTLWARVLSSGRDVYLAENDPAPFANAIGSSLYFGFRFAWWPDLAAPLPLGDIGTPPAWSSDGTRIAFWDNSSTTGTVRLIRRDACRSGLCEAVPLVQGVPQSLLSFSPDDRWLADLMRTSTQSDSLALVDSETGDLRPLGQFQELGNGFDIVTFAEDGSALFTVATSTGGNPRLRGYSVPGGARQDLAALSPGWISDREARSSSRAIVVFEGRSTRGYDVDLLEPERATPLLHLPGTSWVSLVGTGLLLEVGGDIDDLGRGRIYNLDKPGAAPVQLAEQFVGIAATSASRDRLAFFEEPSTEEPTVALSVVSIASGAIERVSRRVPNELHLPLVVLRGTDEVVYVDADGTLHDWRSGGNQHLADHVHNFRLAGDHAYCTIDVGSGSNFDGVSVVEVPLP